MLSRVDVLSFLMSNLSHDACISIGSVQFQQQQQQQQQHHYNQQQQLHQSNMMGIPEKRFPVVKQEIVATTHEQQQQQQKQQQHHHMQQQQHSSSMPGVSSMRMPILTMTRHLRSMKVNVLNNRLMCSAVCVCV